MCCAIKYDRDYMQLLCFIWIECKVPVLFIESTLQHQLLKVDERHCDGDGLQAAVLPNHSHLSLQTVRQTESHKNQREFFIYLYSSFSKVQTDTL